MTRAAKKQAVKSAARIPASELMRLFAYDPSTGKITRAVQTGTRWKIGSAIHTVDRSYICAVVSYNGRTFKIYGHIIAWVLTYGDYPVNKVGHKDDNGKNNKIENLVERSDFVHACKRRIGKNNRSGAKGVHWDGVRQCWRAEISVDKKQIYLGRYTDKENALAAYIAGSQEYHGDAGRVDIDLSIWRSAQ
jgi:hypothetical protein